MKITNEQLRRIIKEELEYVLNEQTWEPSASSGKTAPQGLRKYDPGQTAINKIKTAKDTAAEKIQLQPYLNAQAEVALATTKAANIKQWIEDQKVLKANKNQTLEKQVRGVIRLLEKIKKTIEKQLKIEIPEEKFLEAMEHTGKFYGLNKYFIPSYKQKNYEDAISYWNTYSASDQSNVINDLVAYFNQWHKKLGRTSIGSFFGFKGYEQ